MDEGNYTADTTPIRMRFDGTTGDYFRIWIVNIALTVLTLGIYSAWAKVRTLRYFYTHTWVEDNNFDYHAKPTAILFGRAIAVAALLIYFALGQYFPTASIVFMLVIFALIPVLTVRARIFQMRNTSFNGLRFDFNRNYRDAFVAIYGGAAVAVLTLGMATPTAIFWRNRFVADNTNFGTTPFKLDGNSTPFYWIYLKSFGMVMLGVVLFGVMSGLMAPEVTADETGTMQTADLWILNLMFAPLALVYLFAGVYVKVRQRNLVWNTTSLGESSFVSSLSVRRMCFIYLTNILAIALSVGLLTPWAKVRLAKYRAEHTELKLQNDWNDFIASERRDQSSLGEELGDAFDVGVDVAF